MQVFPPKVGKSNFSENVFYLVYLRFKRARCHELRDQNNTFLSFARSLPGVVEADNVRMLETLQHPGLLFEALALRLGQLAILDAGQRRKVSQRMHTYAAGKNIYHVESGGKTHSPKQNTPY